jgi:catechol 2,3-dioxygenase-like lactoylglutathione lyase family enzyme
MAVERLEHFGIVVTDLEAAIDFFSVLGLTLDGRSHVEGDWVGEIIGLENVRNDFAIMRTPDGDGKLELIQFATPEYDGDVRREPSNAPGLRHVLFRVDDLDDTIARLAGSGGELVGEVVQYEDMYRLCYMWGPNGIIVELAEAIG